MVSVGQESGRGLAVLSAQGQTKLYSRNKVGFLLILCGKESISKLIQGVDSFHFLMAVWLRVLYLCWLLDGGHPQFLEATHSFLPCGLLQDGLLLH